jgi:3-hydroxybutyryl-CoA dehydrogenase
MTSKPTLFVAGAGFMGHGIAQTAASAGYSVILYDLKEEIAAKGIERIRWSLEKLKAKSPETAADPEPTLARIRPTARLEEAASAGFVIEAVLENAAVKEELFGKTETLCPPETIFCSNTSAISISRLAAATKRPDRFCGMHFFSPVPLMKLVEVIRGISTSDETIDRVLTLAREFGKEPVEVKLDRAGFIVNRILIASALEAVRVLEAGLADAKTIDLAMRIGCGYKMGPLELGDMSGLDVFFHAANALYEETGDLKYKAPPLLSRLVAAGHLGQKSGRGFYEHPKKETK